MPTRHVVMLAVAVMLSLCATGCGDDDPAPAGDTVTAVLDVDGGSSSDASAMDSAAEADVGPECAAANSSGFFPDCSACLDATNCDTIDAPAVSGRACGCSSSADCPCGLSCGSYEIAPGISVGGICVAP